MLATLNHLIARLNAENGGYIRLQAAANLSIERRIAGLLSTPYE